MGRDPAVPERDGPPTMIPECSERGVRVVFVDPGAGLKGHRSPRP